MDAPTRPAEDDAPPARPDIGDVALRVLPTLLVLGLLAFPARVTGGPVVNPDTFFHLRFGHEFLGHWSLWHPGSVTGYATRAWVPTQWLGEIVLAKAESWFGLPGVAWMTAAWSVGYAAALYLVCRRWLVAYGAVLLAALAMLASGDFLSGRPQVLSYLLVVVVVHAWLRTAEDGRPRWWLVAIAWVWPLVHGMWILGLVTSGVAALGVVIDRRASLDRRGVLRILAVPAAMALASALTPLGPKIYLAVAVVGSRGAFYTEWGPPNYHQANQIVLAVLLAVLLVAMFRVRPDGWLPVLMVLLCGAWAVYSTRTVPVAAATAAPLAAAVLGGRFSSAPERYARDRTVLLALTALVLAVTAALVPFTSASARPYPRWLDTELDRLPAHTPVLTTDYDGSYLIWRHPDVEVMAHGYGDTFTDAELLRMRQVYGLQQGWYPTVMRLGMRHAVLPDTSSLALALVQDHGWRIVRHSRGLEYLLAPAV